jgi:tellurium resistance protein TerD
MSTSLQAGANISLTKGNPLLNELVIGFGWNTIQSNGPQVDLVPSAIITDANNLALSDDHFVFFNQLATPDDAVRYVEGDDSEQIEVSLSLVPEAVAKIVFIVYVDPDVRKPGNFGSVKNAYMRVADRENNEIARFDLPNADLSINAMIFGEIYKHRDEWKFRALGQGFKDGLSGVANAYKVAL